ncbi:hypothetical protein ACFQJ7_17015 [Halovenus rubra]|uniref:Uncharacterized protein n=2 Tax=Halovenus rubra TaxID=869890 RepID=A0ACC7DV24_9EURY|nr:hypothetical protein [Halovenus rubra]
MPEHQLLRVRQWGTDSEALRQWLANELDSATADRASATGFARTADADRSLDWSAVAARQSPGSSIALHSAEPGGRHLIVGQVRQADQLREGVTVRLYDAAVYDGEAVPASQPIAMDTTGEHGEFVLSYEPESLGSVEAPAVRVSIVDEATRTTTDRIDATTPIAVRDVAVPPEALGIGDRSIEPDLMTDGGTDQPEESAEDATPSDASEAESNRSDDTDAESNRSNPSNGESTPPDGAAAESSEPADEEATPTADADDLFQFMTVRPPEKSDPGAFARVNPGYSTGLVSSLTEAAGEEGARGAVVEQLQAFKDGDAFLETLSAAPLDLTPLHDALAELDADETADEAAADFGAIVEEALGSSPEALVDDDTLEETAGQVLDSLTAASLHPIGVDESVRASLRDGTRLVDAIRRAADGETVDAPAVLDRQVALPEAVPALSALPVESPPSAGGSSGRRADGSTLADRLHDLEAAADELRTAATAPPSGALEAPLTDGEGRQFADEAPARERSAADETDVPAAIRRAERAAGGAVDDATNAQLADAFDSIEQLVDRLAERRAGGGRPLDEDRMADLSDRARSTLSSLGIEPGDGSIDDATERVSEEARRINERLLDETVGAYERLVATEDGPMLIGEGRSSGSSQPLSGSVGGAWWGSDESAEEDDAESYRAEGVTVLGFGDLRVVKQVGPRYEAGEIAHVENVMESETRERVHRESEVTEETTRRKEKTIKSEKQDLQTTQRNEIKRESETVINDQWGVEAGVNVSAKYGPVSVDTNFGYSRQHSKQKSKRTAVSTAQEITRQATRRVEERVTTETTKRIREEIIERNRHAFENDGDDHITGIYRWLEKTYRMDVHEFDRPRLMVEFLVPDPAAGYRYAQGAKPKEKTAEKPIEPKAVDFGGDVTTGAEREQGAPVYEKRLSYDDITPSNYQWYATHYEAEDVPAPPAHRRKKTIKMKGGEGVSSGNDEAPSYDTKFIDVPDGYSVGTVAVFSGYMHRKNHSLGAGIRVNVGTDDPGSGPSHRIQNVHSSADAGDDKADPAETEYFYLNSDEYDRVPVTLSARNTTDYNVVATATLERTDDALREWKAEVHRKIMAAYRRRRDEYESEVEAAKVGAGVNIEGENPKQNRETERKELKRASIELMRRFELDFDAVTMPGENGNDSLSFPGIEESAIPGMKDDLQFFEQSFEWQQGTYVFYPYYWADRESWTTRLTRDDSDPKFESFLTAGAARFVVPVRPGFEPNVMRFMQTGIPFLKEGTIEEIDDPRYVDIVSELRQQQGAAEGSEYSGEHWFNTVPTSLIKLQASDALPDMITPVNELYDTTTAAATMLTEGALGSGAAEPAVDGGWDSSAPPRSADESAPPEDE